MTKAMLVVSTAAMVATSLPAIAQPYDQGGYNQQQPPPGYNDGQQQPPPGYDPNQGPPPGYNGQPQGGYYDGQQPGPYANNQPAPPPPGYDGSQPSYQDQQQDQQYASNAEAWARDNCVRSQNNVAADAVVGGIFGAIIGGVTDRRHPGAGAAWGAGLGGLGGAAVGASQADATSPGCPPGFVVRGGAPAFYYQGGPYYYAAPADYNPWFFYGGHWGYRPYAYHTWYYRQYHGGGGGPRHHRYDHY